MDIFRIFLTIHIAGGTIGLLAGTYIMIGKKGDKRHKLIGRIFSICMLGAGFCSFVLATIHRNDFLFAVGVFTIFLAGTGWRYLYLKNIIDGQRPEIIDWALMIFMILGCVVFLILGIRNIFDQEYFGIIILLFAWRGISFVVKDYKIYKGEITVKNYWLIFHLQRMSAAYIASLTAFAVVNAPDRLSFLPWLLPSAIVVPLIIKWSKKFKVKLTKE
jgi:uncharacterized membrane protein